MIFRHIPFYFILILAFHSAPRSAAQDTVATQGQRQKMQQVALADTVLGYRQGFVDFAHENQASVRLSSKTSGWLLADEGRLTFVFEDNLIIDGPGADLEIQVDSTITGALNAWISADGQYYIPLGDISRSLRIDLNHKAPQGVLYSHLRLRYHTGSGKIRIKTAQALNGPQVLRQNTAALFETRSSAWTPRGDRRVDTLAAAIVFSAPSRLIIEVYSDNRGTDDYLRSLTQLQADQLAGRLIRRLGIDPLTVVALGMGRTAPLTENDTEAGRKTNQRTRLLIYPPKASSHREGPTP